MGSNTRDRKTGTMAWRLENIRKELGFVSHTTWRVYLRSNFSSTSYSRLLRLGEQEGGLSAEDAKFVEKRLEDLADRLTRGQMEYLKSGGAGQPPEKPDGFDAQTEYQNALREEEKAGRKKQVVKNKTDQAEMARYFQKLTQDDDGGRGFFSPKNYMDVLLKNSVPFGLAVQMAMYELEIRGEYKALPLFEAAALACEAASAYGGEVLALEAGGVKSREVKGREVKNGEVKGREGEDREGGGNGKKAIE